MVEAITIAQSRKVYFTLIASKMNMLIVAAPAVNIVRYMPVDEATAGCISRTTMTGVKIDPGPIPTAVAAKAPKNP